MPEFNFSSYASKFTIFQTPADLPEEANIFEKKNNSSGFLMNGSLYVKSFKYQKAILHKTLCISRTTLHSEQHALFPHFTSLQCGSILQSLTKIKDFRKGRQLHAHMVTCGRLQDNAYLNTKLAAFYAGCGRMSEAHVIFDGTVLKNSFLWNSMIRGFACFGHSLRSLVLYREMLSYGQKADNFTYPFVLKACGDMLLVEIGRRVHGEVVVSGLESDIYVCNSLMAMYSKFGDMESASVVFGRMLKRDLISWNTMISGCVNNENPREAIVIFELLQKSGLSADGTTLLGLLSACAELMAMKQGKEIHGHVVRNNGEVFNGFLTNALIEMYCTCNSVIHARILFEGAKFKDVVSWNSIISGYERSGDAFESIKLFCQMVKEGAAPDEVTVVAVLGACGQITALQFGMSVHSYLLKEGYGVNIIVGTALLDMYSKCGSLSCSHRVFDDLPQKNMVSWSAIIAGYGAHGRGREAISIFHEMVENCFIPDEGVLSSVLSACSHAGLVNEGKEFFHRMTMEYNVKPGLVHYSCIVDLIGRAGNLDEAYELIQTMEVNPTADIWAALLSACRLHKNVKLAEISAQNVFAMNPKDVSSYICLSNVYAAEKQWDAVNRVRSLIRGRGLIKPPGCSLIVLDKMIHRFLVGDKSHQQTVHIYAKLEDLNLRLKEAGYRPDTSSVLYDVKEDVKEKMLWDHSERLAIAFALINTRPGTTIRITKNLRVCCDCHTVTKMISKLTCREIVMRDIHRFHHFRDGVCSCGDYW